MKYKLTIKHYLNQHLKPIQNKFPVYVSVTYKRKNYKIKSMCLGYCTEPEFFSGESEKAKATETENITQFFDYVTEQIRNFDISNNFHTLADFLNFWNAPTHEIITATIRKYLFCVSGITDTIANYIFQTAKIELVTENIDFEYFIPTLYRNKKTLYDLQLIDKRLFVLLSLYDNNSYFEQERKTTSFALSENKGKTLCKVLKLNLLLMYNGENMKTLSGNNDFYDYICNVIKN